MTISSNNSIIYIESPLQILSAIEFCNEYDEKPIIIVNFGNKKRVKNKSQMLSLLSNLPAKKVLEYKHFRNSLIRDIYTFFFMLKVRNLPASDRFLIGDFRSKIACNLFLANRSKERIYMDDGAATIVTQIDHIQNGIYAPQLRSKRQRIFQSFYDFFFNFKYSELSCPNLYSFFTGNNLLKKGQINYRTPKELINKDKIHNTCFFFGSKYSESGLMNLDNEISCLCQIKDYYHRNNINFFYIPHRDESEDKLFKIKKLGINIKVLDVPAETYFENSEKIPDHISACWSTVVYSVGKAYNLKSVISFDILDWMKSSTACHRAKTVYKFYRKCGVQIIKI